MRRRTFIASIGCAAAVWPLAARAQPRVPRIGFLGWDKMSGSLGAFEAGLSDLGYVPGKTIEIEYRFGLGEERMTELARELVDLKVELIVTNGVGVYAAHRVTTTVPIVVGSAADLVMQGYADSLDHPGGNVTGQIFFYAELVVKRIELLRQIRPAMTSVGLLLIQGRSSNPSLLQAIDAPVKALGIELKPIEVAEASDCDRALSAGSGTPVGGLVVTDSSEFTSTAAVAVTIATVAVRHRLPAAAAPLLARNGVLLGYGVDFPPMYRHAAIFVDRILKGAKPGDIPIERATKFETILNLKTAKALGLEIAPTLLAAATEVIE